MTMQIIPETRWTSATSIGCGKGGILLLIVKDRKMRFLSVLRWPWAQPIEIVKDGSSRLTRWLVSDHRDNPLPFEQIAVDGKTILDFMPEVG